MADSKIPENTGTNTQTRSDLDGEEYRDGAFYKPISTREYFKLLGYCLIGLAVIGLFLILFFRFFND